ncbi:hypothetical protein [Streptomyces sp. NPDC047976]
MTTPVLGLDADASIVARARELTPAGAAVAFTVAEAPDTLLWRSS